MPSFEQMAWAAGRKSLADLKKKTQKATEPQPIGLGSGEWTDLEIERIRSISKTDPKRIDSLIDGMTDAEVDELTNAMKAYDQKKGVYKRGAEDIDLTASGAPPGLASVMPAYEQPEMVKDIAAGARKSKVLSGTMFASDKEIAKEIGIPYERISRIPGYREGMLMESYQSGIPSLTKAVQRMKASGKPDVAAAAESLEMDPEPAFIAGALGRVKDYVRGAGRLGKQSLKAITPSQEGSEKWDDNIILSEATRLAEELPKREAYGENPAYRVGGIAADFAIPSLAGKIKEASTLGKAGATVLRIAEGAGQAAVYPDEGYVSPEDYWSTMGEKAKTGAMWTAGALGSVGSAGFLARKTLEKFPSLAKRLGVEMSEVAAKGAEKQPEDIKRAGEYGEQLRKKYPEITPTRATLSGSEAVQASELEAAGSSQKLLDIQRRNVDVARSEAEKLYQGWRSKVKRDGLLEAPMEEIERIAADPKHKRNAMAKSVLAAYKNSGLEAMDQLGVNMKARALNANVRNDILFDTAGSQIRTALPSDPAMATEVFVKRYGQGALPKATPGPVDTASYLSGEGRKAASPSNPIWTGEKTMSSFAPARADIEKLDFVNGEAKSGFLRQLTELEKKVMSGERVLDYDNLRAIQKEVRALKASLTDPNVIKQDFIDQMKINPLSKIEKATENDIVSTLAKWDKNLLRVHTRAINDFKTNVVPYSDAAKVSKALENEDWAGLYRHAVEIKDRGELRDFLKLLGPEGRRALTAARMEKAMQAASVPQAGLAGPKISIKRLARETDIQNDPMLREMIGRESAAELKGLNRLLSSVGFAEGKLAEAAEPIKVIATSNPKVQSVGLIRQARTWWNASAYHKDPTFRSLLKRAAVANPDKLDDIYRELQRIASRYMVGRRMDARNAPKEDTMPVGSSAMDDFDAEAELDMLER